MQLGGEIVIKGSLLVPFELHQSGSYLLLQGGLMGTELVDLVRNLAYLLVESTVILLSQLPCIRVDKLLHLQGVVVANEVGDSRLGGKKLRV